MQYLSIYLVLISLSLTVADVKKKNVTDFYGTYVKSLNYEVHTGYISQNSTTFEKTSNNAFYQLVYLNGSRNFDTDPNTPLIVWLQGGPGCGGSTGLFLEVGPFIVSGNNSNGSDFVVTEREQSWNQVGHLLFVDQPFGAGYSYSDSKYYVNSTDASAKYFSDFLQQFLNAYPEFQQSPIYLFGESYAGHYIPSFAKDLLTNPVFTYKSNYKGVGIGDGLTQALNQVTYYSQYLYSAGLIDDKELGPGIYQQGLVQQMILANKLIEAGHIQDNLIANEKTVAGINQYNIKDYTSSLDGNPYADFQGAHREDFGIPQNINVNNTSCNDSVYNAFALDIAQDFTDDVVFLLNKGQVLLYNGQLDFIINTPGALAWINQLKWDKIQQWRSQTKQFFKVSDYPVGTYKQYDNFTFAVIYQAGHLVPQDQPVAAFAMLKHFINKDTKWE